MKDDRTGRLVKSLSLLVVATFFLAELERPANAQKSVHIEAKSASAASTEAAAQSDGEAKKELTPQQIEGHRKQIASISETILKAPDNEFSYIDRAEEYIFLKNFNAATADCQRAIKLNPESAEAYVLLGRINARNRKHGMAVDYYTKAINLDKDFGEAYFRRGFSFKQLKDSEHCDQDLQQAKELSFDIKKNIDFGSYMNDLKRKIKRCWFPPKGQESKHCVVTFMIFRDGHAQKIAMFKSSGNALMDKACLAAVKNAEPFSPFPPGSKPRARVEFSFDFNVFGSK